MLNYLAPSWLNLSVGEMVHIIFHELVLKAVEEVRLYSLSQEVNLMNWLPVAV